jgi:cytochrome o ubiquinol oxidase subunit IV
MSLFEQPSLPADRAPGWEQIGGGDVARGIGSYLLGLTFAALLTVASFFFAESGIIWAPAVPVALVALAIGQMGVHLAFFLHITTGPESTNNVLALAFGALIVVLVIAGSIWIMAHLNASMVPGQMMDMPH